MWPATGTVTMQNTAETDCSIDMADRERAPVHAARDEAAAINSCGVGTSYDAGPSLTASRQTNLHARA
jgi:hypothetical protein